MEQQTWLLYFNLGVLGVTFFLLLRGDLRTKREVEREREATAREREIGDGYKATSVATAASLDRLTNAVLGERAEAEQ